MHDVKWLNCHRNINCDSNHHIHKSMNIECTLFQPSSPVSTLFDDWVLLLVIFWDIFRWTCNLVTMELVFVQFVIILGFLWQFYLSDIDHIECSCATTTNETNCTKYSKLSHSIIWNDKNYESTGQHSDISRVCETISIINKLILFVHGIGELINDGHMRNLYGSPSDIKQCWQRDIVKVLHIFWGNSWVINEIRVHKDAGESWEDKEWAEEVPWRSLSTFSGVFVTHKPDNGCHDSICKLTR